MSGLIELNLIKQGLKDAGLPQTGLFYNNYKNLTHEEKKQWKQITDNARLRAKELKTTFPFAFGEFRKTEMQREFFAKLCA
ncbi:MAG: hypothetical protein KAJ54_02980 [Candidatus Aenigmarchaeota archaeon]|nr:hypothetical protein [Candidatus Aenigmarchaeota archaeon]